MAASGGAYVREQDGTRRLVEAPRESAARGPREADGTEIDRVTEIPPSPRPSPAQAGEGKKKGR